MDNNFNDKNDTNDIEINNITYKYKKGRTVFEDFSLRINSNESTVITGKNGCGKTTLTKLIMGILKPNFGYIKIFGQDIKNLTLGQIGEMIGYVFQYPENQIFATSVVEQLTFPLVFKGYDSEYVNERAEKLIETFDLQKVKDLYPFFLSYGEKRRLAIASVLMNKPRYVVLDEPTASLDNERIEIISEVIDKLKFEGIGVLIISHNDFFTKRHGDRIINIGEGSVLSDEKF
jgi:energy-coupling factor transport system ATP-binding protein